MSRFLGPEQALFVFMLYQRLKGQVRARAALLIQTLVIDAGR